METVPLSQPARQRLILLWLGCWLGFAALALWQASGGSAVFDYAGMTAWRTEPDLMPFGPDWLTCLMRGLTEIGGGAVRLPLAAVVIVYLLWRQRKREAGMLLALATLTPAFNSLLKLLFARPRPDLVPYFAEFSDLAFPSGHSASGTATYLGLALITTAAWPRWRLPAVAAALCLSIGIAASRVWLGVHWPTDAIAGWLTGVGWVALVWAVGSRPARGGT